MRLSDCMKVSRRIGNVFPSIHHPCDIHSVCYIHASLFWMRYRHNLIPHHSWSWLVRHPPSLVGSGQRPQGVHGGEAQRVRDIPIRVRTLTRMESSVLIFTNCLIFHSYNAVLHGLIWIIFTYSGCINVAKVRSMQGAGSRGTKGTKTFWRKHNFNFFRFPVLGDGRRI